MRILLLVVMAFACWRGTAFAAESGSWEYSRSAEPLAIGPAKIYTLPHIRLTRIELPDNDLVTAVELQRIAGPYLGKDISYEQLEVMRHELSKVIAGKGYINSGVIIPDQQVKDGVVTFDVVRGALTSVELEGNRYFSDGYLKARIERNTRPPLNINVLQENLQLLQLDPRIKTINAELKPGKQPGESVLKSRIVENRPYTLLLETGNGESPSTGSYSGYATLTYSNLIGTGDMVEARIGASEGNQDYGAKVSIPLNRFDTTFEVFFRKGESTVTEDLFKDLDIESSTDTYGFRVVQPLYQALRHRLQVSLGGEYRASTTSLLGRNYSFSEGADNGKSRVSVIRFSQEYVNRGSGHVFAISSCLNFGIDALGATVHHNGEPDGVFTSWLGQALFIWRIGRTQLVFRDDAQLSGSRLLTMEKFSVGGINSVRGYRRSLFVRDNGVSGTVELRIPLMENREGEALFSVIPFYDYGYAWDRAGGANQRNRYIHGVGAGIKWQPFKGANVEFYYGHALKSIQVTDRDPQDNGIHFHVSWQVF